MAFLIPALHVGVLYTYYAELAGVLLENILSAPVVKHGDNGNKHTLGCNRIAQETF